MIATKFGQGEGRDDNASRPRLARVHALGGRGLARSGCGTDYVDLYQYHRPDGVTPIEETLGAMDELVDEGKVRFIGSSNFSAAQVEEADRVARDARLRAVRRGAERVLVARARGAEDELFRRASGSGSALLPYFPLASGLLTGKYRRERAEPEGTRLAGRRGPGRATGTGSRRCERSRPSAASRCSTSRSAASPRSRRSASVIAGATQPEQVRANAAAGEWEPSAAELDELRSL